jgi:O-antigen/teichoic acid export membrane protein
MVALNTAVIQRHFLHSQSGVRPKLRRTFRSLAVTAVLGTVIAIAIRGVAPLLPSLTGHDYAGAIQVLRFLCWLPLIRGFHQICGSVVTGTGHQNWRTAAQCSVALLNVVLNWTWIPRLGWVGAAWATLASDGSLVALNALLLLFLARTLLNQEANSSQPAAICEDA